MEENKIEENKKHPSHMTAEEIKKDIKQVIERNSLEEEAKKDMNERVEKKKQAISVSYTLKAMKQNIDKLSLSNLIETKDYEELNKIYHKIVLKYIDEQFM